MDINDIQYYLQPGEYTDSDHYLIISKTGELTGTTEKNRDKAKILFEYVRDQIDENHLDNYKASEVLKAGRGFCYNKSILLSALCRAAGIPARIAFDHVIIHKTNNTIQFLHGITEIYLDNCWRKYDSTGNIKRWKMWSDLEHTSQKLPLEFSSTGNVLFTSSNDILINRTDYHFFDWSNSVDQFVTTFTPAPGSNKE